MTMGWRPEWRRYRATCVLLWAVRLGTEEPAVIVEVSAGTEEVAVEIAISSNGSKAVMSAGTEEVTPETRRVWFKFAAVPEEVTPETRTVSVELVGTEEEFAEPEREFAAVTVDVLRP